jgi:hypothetical protein
VLSEHKYFVYGNRQTFIYQFYNMRRYQRGKSIVTKILISGFDIPVIVSNGKKVEGWKVSVREALHRNSKRLQNLCIDKWRRQEHEIADDFLHDPMASSDLLPASSALAEESPANTKEPTFQLFDEADISQFWTELFWTANQFGFPQDETFPFDIFT